MLRLLINLDGIDVPLDVPVFPKAGPIADYVIADGTKLPVWQRAGSKRRACWVSETATARRSRER